MGSASFALWDARAFRSNPPLLTALASARWHEVGMCRRCAADTALPLMGNVKKSCLAAQSMTFAARVLGSEALMDALREDGDRRGQATEVTKRAEVPSIVTRRTDFFGRDSSSSRLR